MTRWKTRTTRPTEDQTEVGKIGGGEGLSVQQLLELGLVLGDELEHLRVGVLQLLQQQSGRCREM